MISACINLRMIHPNTGRYMEVYSNHPGLQFYTGNNLCNADGGCSAMTNCAGDKDFTAQKVKFSLKLKYLGIFLVK